MSAENKMLQAALAYAAWGWCVVPLHTPNGDRCSCGRTAADCGNSTGKHPRITDWEQRASTDPATIRQWWGKWPDANLGIACGPSGLISVDVDVKNGIDGRETWHDLQQQHGFSDDGALVNLTGSGGQQLIFRNVNGLDLGNTTKRLGPGIDTRGSGGLFVAPPSLHYSGKVYAWDVGAHPADITPAPIPDPLAQLLQADGNGKAPTVLPSTIPDGQRDTDLTSLAGTLRNRGLDEAEMLETLRIVNRRCDPPKSEGDLERIAKSVSRYEPGQIVLAQPPPTVEPPPPQQPEPAEPPNLVELEECPALPEAAQVDPELGAGAGQWVDRYTDYGLMISPMTPRSFHESAALWLGAVGIARRLKVAMYFGDVYPNLFVHWLAYTTLFRKSTALDVARNLARRVFPHLMAAQDTTPEAFLSDLAGREPPYFDALTEEDRNDWKEGRNYAAQKGWLLDEMSGLLAGAGREYNAGLIESCLRLYDCDPYYVRSTRGQGRVVVRNGYLSLLGASTPAAMAPHLSAERLWAMGWWPRFAVLTPDTDRPPWRVGEWGKDGQEPPSEVVEGLAQLYACLPPPTWPEPPETHTARLGAGVYEAWEHYNQACSYDLLTDDLDQRLHGTYGRLPIHVLKVGLILAALDGWPKHWNGPSIELRHVARAIAICEDWRASAHRAIATVTRSEFDRLRTRIRNQIAKAGPAGPSLRDLNKAMQDVEPEEIERGVTWLIKMGEVEGYGTTGVGRPTTRYRMVTE